MNRSASLRLAVPVLLIAMLGCLAVPAVAKNVKPKTGTFFVAGKKPLTKIQVFSGKFDEIWVYAKLTKAGQTCVNDGAVDPQRTYILFYAKKGGKVSKKGTFDVTAAAPGGSNLYKGATARLKGKFTSSSKASFTASVDWNGCKSGTVKYNIKYGPGD